MIIRDLAHRHPVGVWKDLISTQTKQPRTNFTHSQHFNINPARGQGRLLITDWTGRSWTSHRLGGKLIFPLRYCPQHPLAVGNAPSLHPLKLRGGSPTSSGRNSVGCQEQLQPTHPCLLQQGAQHHSITAVSDPFSATAQPSSMLISFISFVSYHQVPLLPPRAPGKANTGLPGTINQWQHLPSSFVKQALHWALKPKAVGEAHALIVN